MTKGWYGQRHRHGLASKGIRSSDEFLLSKSPEEQAFITRTMTPCVKCGEWVNKAHISDSGLCNICNTMARGNLTLLEQVIQFKFPLRFEIDDETIEKYRDYINEFSDGDKDFEKWLIKKMKNVKVKQRDFFDYTGLKDEYESTKEDLKWEYRDYKEDMRDSGYREDIQPFNIWLGENYGMGGMNFKQYIMNYVDEDEIQEHLDLFEKDIKDDLTTWIDV